MSQKVRPQPDCVIKKDFQFRGPGVDPVSVSKCRAPLAAPDSSAGTHTTPVLLNFSIIHIAQERFLKYELLSQKHSPPSPQQPPEILVLVT